jgi:hypothetical protein
MSLDLFTFTYYYGNGDYYTGQGYAEAGTYAASQVLTGYANETGYEGYYTIDSVIDSGYDSSSGYNNLIYLTSYYDSDTGYGSAYYYTYGNGYSGLGSESGYAYNDSFLSDSFSNSNEADLLSQYYTFTYYYGNGDSYSGYGYAGAATYAAGQVLSGYTNETGNQGYYTIDSLDDPTNYLNDQNYVYVTSYYDGDTSYSYASSVYGFGFGDLGSESGTVTGFYSSDSFSWYDEADLISSNNHSVYYLTDYLSWLDAQAQAQAMGGNLATINDATENQFLANAFDVGWLWIGYTDQAEEGVWQWISGETSTYTNWAQWEPNNNSGDEHYAVTNWEGSGTWNDLPNWYGNSIKGIVEVVGGVSSLSISDVSVAENGSYSVLIPVTLKGITNQIFTVDYSLAPGTATENQDYTLIAGTLTFNPGDSVQYITVSLQDDSDIEGNETFFVNLSNVTGGAVLDQSTATVTIAENNEKYTFTYTYGNGDSYSGYGYALAGTYAAEQVLSGYSNETGNDGYYTIDYIEDGGELGTEGLVYVTSYTDGDTGFGTTTSISGYYWWYVDVNGYSGLGSESGYAYNANNSGDNYFSNYSEADLPSVVQVRLNLLADDAGNPGELIANNQIGVNKSFFVEILVADLRGNAVGVNGLGLDLAWDGFILESINFDPSLDITSQFPLLQDGTLVYDGFIDDLSGGSLPEFELGQAIGVNQLERFALLHFYTENSSNGTSYFTTTVSSAALADDASYSLDVEENQPIEILSSYNQYNFTYNYGNGDFYTGYVYALEGTYAAGQVLEGYYNETGNYGSYTIDSVSAGTADSSYNNQIYVTSYYDGDTGYGYADLLDSYTGYSGLGSEQGYAYDSNWNSSDSYFSNYYEADILGNQLFNYTYYYGNGDSYSGYGYAAVDTYAVGQTIDYGYNETGNYGYYTIDSVELGNTSTGYNGYVYITSYTDGDTSYAYGTTTNVGTNWGYPLAGIYGLSSEYGYAYTAEGTSHDSYFSNYYEADLTVPSISITDNSGDIFDASIKFTTELSKFRKNYSDSDFVRPNYADSSKYFDITNTGTGLLTVSGLQINVAGVTTDLDLTEGDLLLNPNQSQRVQLTYTAAAAKEVFDRSDALVLFTNALDLPEFAIALSGKSTFNSDINYNGIVNTGDLGALNQARSNYNKGILDPTADINGDGMINSLDVSVLLSENKQSVFV